MVPKVGRIQLPCTPYSSLQNALGMEMGLGSRTQLNRVLQGWFGISVICALSHTTSSLEPMAMVYGVHAGMHCTSTLYAKMIHKTDD